MQRIYLDYAASTPVDPRVLEAMLPYFGSSPARHPSATARHERAGARQRAGVAGWGNPGSLHSFGQEAMAAVDKSRGTIARAIGADFREVVFTGSATEANNLALRGSIRGLTQTVRRQTQTDSNFRVGPREVRESQRPRLIVSAIEHESVLETVRDLEREGVEVIYLPVNREGIVNLEKLKNSLNERTIMVSVMYVNNEIGTIQPLFEIKKIIDDFKNRNFQKEATYHLLPTIYPLFHTDAAQAFQFLGCDVNKLGVDLMTLSSHKIYGPKGVGTLYVRNLPPTTYHLLPTITGGGQEFGLRSGTENVPAIVGFAEAVEIASSVRYQVSSRIAGLRDYFWRQLRGICPEARTNANYTRNNAEKGPRPPASAPARLASQREAGRSSAGEWRAGKSASRPRMSATLPNILNVYFPGREAQFLLTKLDLAGVAASSGSACRSRAMESSYVIEALGYSKERAKSSIRFSFGRPTTMAEVQRALAIIKRCL